MIKSVDPRKFSSNREKQLQEEIEEIENSAKKEVEQTEERKADERENEQLSQEELTYKKRYGDLRRFQQAKETEFSERIKALESQLEAASKKEVQMPSTEEEFGEWVQKYPDLYRILRTIVIKENKDEFNKVQEKFKELSEKEKEQRKAYAYSMLLKAHPDFEDLKPEIATWLETQSPMIRKTLTDNETDFAAAISTVRLFKAERDAADPEKRRQKERDAASSVRANNSGSPSDNQRTLKFRESDVRKMSWKEYERHQAEIEKCMVENPSEFYDLSGAAR